MRNKMDELLKKYWEGETSLEEEKFIRTYFREGEIAEEHLPFKSMFHFFDEEAKITPARNKEAGKRQRKKTRLPGLRIAAAIAVLVVTGALIYWNVSDKQVNSDDVWAAYEIEDPQEAKEKAVEALAFLSGKLNHGKENVRTNLKTLNKLPVK